MTAPLAPAAAAALARQMSAPPQHPELRAVLAAMARRDLKSAWARLQAFVAAHPSDLTAYRLLGQLALNAGRPDMAETIFARLVALLPDFAPLRFDLASARFGQGKAAAARAEIAPLLARDPRNPALRALDAAARSKTGDFEGAAAAYAKLVAEHPRHLPSRIALAQLQRTLRATDAAVATLRAAIAIAPTSGEAWWNLANLKTGALTAADMAALRAALARPGLAPDDQVQLRFALARAEEEAGDFAAAWGDYKAANATRLAQLPPGADAATRAEAAIAALAPEKLAAAAGKGNPDSAPIFILGLQRSGSTLLEQMLAQHPAIEGTQELPDLPLLAGAVARDPARAAPDALVQLGAEYLAATANHRRLGRRHFIDKQPANWQHIALIGTALPGARIIDMRRDALACGLSLFRQHFAGGARFSYAIAGIAEEIAAHDRVMAAAHAALPGRIRRVDLEALIAAPEATLRDLCGFLGLDYAPQCLDFASSDRPVHTPSSEQVRRPLNDDATRLLAGFAPHIGELRAALSL